MDYLDDIKFIMKEKENSSDILKDSTDYNAKNGSKTKIKKEKGIIMNP